MEQALFLPGPVAGLCLFGALLLADRRAALWALCGSAVGIYVALLTGACEDQALAGLAGYNPALAALALSQLHLSALAPALGIVLAISGGLAFEQLGLPPLTMPFILACWAVTSGHRLYRSESGRQPS
jgi:urea transporter